MNEKHFRIYKYFKIFSIFNLPFLVSDSVFLFGELGCLLISIVIWVHCIPLESNGAKRNWDVNNGTAETGGGFIDKKILIDYQR